MNELTIDLKTDSNVPLYEQIYEYIRGDIRKGYLKSGDRLPSTRALSKHLEISRSTVELAYEQLESEGYIESMPYRGFFVSQIEDLYELKDIRPQKAAMQQKKPHQYLYDFTLNGVDLKSFPYSIWRKISKEILLNDQAELFRLGDSQGEYGLRKAICNYLHQARGVNCEPEQIIVGAGNDYLLMMLGSILGSKSRIAVENPTYKRAYRIFDNMSFSVRTIEMDQSGMNVEKLRDSGCNVAFVMPSHQYPLGIVMPIKRRMELLHWAEETEDRYIIEDDYDSEFRYKGKPIPSLQGVDANGKVVYMGTFSKSIAPAIRMSYMVLPFPLLQEYARKFRFLHSTVSKIDQLVVEQFMEEGYYERHLNKMRALYKNRHDVLLNCLKQWKDYFTISGENAGVHLLLHLKNGMSEEEFMKAAKKKEIRVYGLSEYYITIPAKKYQPTILLGYANMDEGKIKKAVEVLGTVFSNE